MNQEKALDKLLNNIIEDNSTYKFPVIEFEFELTALFMDKLNYKIHLDDIRKKLKQDYSSVLSRIFLKLYIMHFNIDEIENMSLDEYYEKTESFIKFLYNVRITIVSKDSDDYELLRSM